MSRSYRHIQEYETEILSLKEQGKTKREIGEQLGFTTEQIHGFIASILLFILVAHGNIWIMKEIQ